MPLEELKNYLSSPNATNDIVLDYHSFLVLESRARKSGLQKDPQVLFDMKQAVRKVLVSAYMNQLADQIRPIDDDAVLKERYLALKDYFKVPERRSFSHILISAKPLACGWSDEAVESPMERAEFVLNQLKEGMSFDDAAREYSDDRASAIEGGKLPGDYSVTSKELDTQFLKAGYEILSVGDYSPIIQTINGFHIIRLDSIEKARVIPFEEARETVRATVYGMQRDSKLQEEKSSTYPRPNAIELKAITEIGNAIMREREAKQDDE